MQDKRLDQDFYQIEGIYFEDDYVREECRSGDALDALEKDTKSYNIKTGGPGASVRFICDTG